MITSLVVSSIKQLYFILFAFPYSIAFCINLADKFTTPLLNILILNLRYYLNDYPNKEYSLLPPIAPTTPVKQVPVVIPINAPQLYSFKPSINESPVLTALT